MKGAKSRGRRDLHPSIESSIYTPSKNPGPAFLLVTFIVLVGILGTMAVSRFFMIFATIFWIQYTAILVYLQFLRGSKYPRKTLTEQLLNPNVRFFVFIFLATVGLIGSLRADMWIGYSALVAWWIFSLNFYMYFKEWKKAHAL